MKKIILTKGLFATVDDEDYDYLNKFEWYAQCNGGGKYYATTRINNKLVLMHKLIMKSPGIDHINNNSLDNQKSNLRLATKSQNAANSIGNGARSGYKGVYRERGQIRYFAVITVNYKQIYLGRFSTAREAAVAYDAAAIKHFGEYANLNFQVT